MAEEVGTRCGRRKQRNPKRKNENEENLEGSVDKTDKDLTKDQPQTTCNGLPEDTENSCHSDKMVAADTSTESDLPSHLQNGDVKKEKSDLELPNIPSTEKSILKADQNRVDKLKLHNNVMSSDDPINEFLNRSDTAIIYPEPVSDQDDDDDNSHSDSVGPPEEELVLRCIHCGEGFTRASLLRDHMHAHHPEHPIKYLCPKCDETFLLKSQLDKHLALHSPTSQVCRVCNKTFANVYRLQRHMISHDESNDLRKFKCPECGKAFKFKHHLKEHIRIHSGEKPFECPNCGKRFSHSGSYSSHMTSKKCWVVGANKNRPVERSGTTEPNLAYTAGRTPVSVMDSPLQSPPPGSYPHYLPFDPRKAAIPAYYSPPTSSIHSYVPPYIYPVRHNTVTTVLPAISNQSLTNSLCRPISTPSSFVKVSSTQISPDVNSNTQLLSIQGENTSTPIKVTQPPKSFVTSDSSPKRNSVNDNNDQDGSNGVACSFCGAKFENPIDQHQHERYLCKLNKDITSFLSHNDSARNSPNSEGSEVSRNDVMNGSLSTGTDDEEEANDSGKEENTSADNKKLRERSLISDEQLQILKTYYQVNPRPRKFELIRIGNEIGFPKRVVQVWFQNMRARDRKKGKDVPYFPSMARFKIQDESPMHWKDMKTKSSYIPVVPQPYAHQSKPNGQLIHTAPQAAPPRPTSVAIPDQTDQPLDLSIKKSPPRAHSSNSSVSATPPRTLDEQVLNLSVKSEPLAEMKTRPEGSLQDSAIYKYMQQEGLFFHPQFIQNSQTFSNAFMAIPSQKMQPVTAPLTVKSTPLPLTVKSEVLSNSPKSEPDPVNSKTCSDTQSSQLDESGSIDEDEPSRKKRKSWKNHKLDAEDGLYSCDQCDKLFSKQSSLARHKYEHSGARPFHCEICTKAFKHKHHLTEHRRLHTGDKPFKCKKCGKRFSHSGSYSQHMNHRYKYCKPMKDDDGETDTSYEEGSGSKMSLFEV
ncbi:hypothetical protein ScPMuIL_012371 [Solemya velum]